MKQDRLIQQIRVSKNREEVEDGGGKKGRKRENGEVQNIPRLWAWHFFYQLDNLIISAYITIYIYIYIHTSPLSFLHIKTLVIYLRWGRTSLQAMRTGGLFFLREVKKKETKRRKEKKNTHKTHKNREVFSRVKTPRCKAKCYKHQ